MLSPSVQELHEALEKACRLAEWIKDFGNEDQVAAAERTWDEWSCSIESVFRPRP